MKESSKWDSFSNTYKIVFDENFFPKICSYVLLLKLYFPGIPGNESCIPEISRSREWKLIGKLDALVGYETFLFETQNEKEDKSLSGSRKPEKCFRNGLLKSGLPTNPIIGNSKELSLHVWFSLRIVGNTA